MPTILHVIYVPFAITDGTDMEDSREYVADCQLGKLLKPQYCTSTNNFKL